MKLANLQAKKIELADKAATEPTPKLLEALGLDSATDEVRQRYASASPRLGYVPGVALGVAKGVKKGDYHLDVTVRTKAEGEAYARAVKGEARVHVVPEVRTRVTPQYLQETHDTGIPGEQIGPYGFGFVGSVGVHARHRVTGKYLALTCEHVVGSFGQVPPGHPIVQGAMQKVIGVRGELVPRIPGGHPNVVDAGAVNLEEDGDFWEAWNDAIDGHILGWRNLTPDDLGAEVAKVGRTTGETRGTVEAVEKDGLAVGTERGLVHYIRQVSILGVEGRPFSQAGDSGSGVVLVSEQYLVADLHAGGPDMVGNDWTYACNIVEFCDALNADPLVAA